MNDIRLEEFYERAITSIAKGANNKCAYCEHSPYKCGLDEREAGKFCPEFKLDVKRFNEKYGRSLSKQENMSMAEDFERSVLHGKLWEYISARGRHMNPIDLSEIILAMCYAIDRFEKSQKIWEFTYKELREIRSTNHNL